MALAIPNYHVLEKLGDGAQSRLYRARCTRTGKDYTVKIVKLVRPEAVGVLELLKNEYAVGSLIDHSVLRKVYELRMIRHRFRVRGAILFMEYVEGRTLADKDFNEPLPEVLRILGEVATGLRAMHLSGYVHADLKPSNILVTGNSQVKLIDFGQSSPIYQAKTRVQGTIDYMAPEQVQRGPLDQRTDVFALGAALHRVVTGKPIPTEMNQTVTLNSASLVGKRVSQINRPAMDELPACIVRLLEDCCQSNPGDRLADMNALIERIDLARTILLKPPTADDEEDEFEEHYDLTDDEDGSLYAPPAETVGVDPEPGPDRPEARD